MLVEETLGSAALLSSFEELNTLPSRLAWSEGNEKKSWGDRPCWGGLFWACSAKCLLGGRSCDLDLKIPVSSNRRFIYGIRVSNTKMPRPLAFDRHVEVAIIEAQKPRSTTVLRPNTICYNGCTRSGEEPALQCRRRTARRTHRH